MKSARLRYSACLDHGTPTPESGGLVWYPNSLRTMRPEADLGIDFALAAWPSRPVRRLSVVKVMSSGFVRPYGAAPAPDVYGWCEIPVTANGVNVLQPSEASRI